MISLHHYVDGYNSIVKAGPKGQQLGQTLEGYCQTEREHLLLLTHGKFVFLVIVRNKRKIVIT
jgi:hypothetical protein